MANAKSVNIKVAVSKDKLEAYVAARENEQGVLSKEEVLEALNAAGVIYGLKDGVISSFVLAPSSDPHLVAEGIPPIKGVDERVELFFPTGKEKNTENIEEDEYQVDFRETSTLVSVEAGALLAKKHPGSPGTDGMAVTGSKIAAPLVRNIKLQAGKGAVLSEDQSQVTAEVNGRPWIREVGPARFVGVEPVLVHKGDVCIKSGNLRFKGDARVVGNVCEAMVVEVSGDIEITGLVTRAVVNSGGKMVLRRGVIGSQIKAGYSFPGSKKLAFMLQDIQSELVNLSKALVLLKEKGLLDFRRVDFARTVNTLMDNRFKELRAHVRHLLKEAASAGKTAKLPDPLERCLHAMKCLIGLSSLTPESYSNVCKEVEASLEFLNKNAQNPADITLSSAMTSVLHSSGNINIIGQGCVNTNLAADGNVIINGSFKGGEIYCDGYVQIRELGSALGVPPVVRVPEDKYIKVNKAFIGSVLQIGHRRMIIPREMGPFKAKIGQDETIEII